MNPMLQDGKYPGLGQEDVSIGSAEPGKSTGTDPGPYHLESASTPATAVSGTTNEAGDEDGQHGLPDGSDAPTDAVVALRLGAQLLRELMRPEDEEPEEPGPT